jgi:hypothetical protein
MADLGQARPRVVAAEEALAQFTDILPMELWSEITIPTGNLQNQQFFTQVPVPADVTITNLTIAQRIDPLKFFRGRTLQIKPADSAKFNDIQEIFNRTALDFLKDGKSVWPVKRFTGYFMAGPQVVAEGFVTTADAVANALWQVGTGDLEDIHRFPPQFGIDISKDITFAVVLIAPTTVPISIGAPFKTKAILGGFGASGIVTSTSV